MLVKPLCSNAKYPRLGFLFVNGMWLRRSGFDLRRPPSLKLRHWQEESEEFSEYRFLVLQYFLQEGVSGTRAEDRFDRALPVLQQMH